MNTSARTALGLVALSLLGTACAHEDSDEPQEDDLVDTDTTPLVTTTWAPCTREGATCSFSGVKAVRYGAAGQYAYRALSDGAACNNATFGDPLPGVSKSCDTADVRWQRCANEGGTCSSTGQSVVRYGDGSRYTYREIAGSFDCNNGVFGDPAPGVAKRCDIAEVPSTANNYCSNVVRPAPEPVATAPWAACARQGATCSFSGVKAVRFGAAGQYAYRAFRGSAACDAATFGDPVSGVVKSCDTTDVQWQECANEGETCSFAGRSIVRYGDGSRYAYREAAGSVGCNNGVFGDPASGVRKRCEFAVVPYQVLNTGSSAALYTSEHFAVRWNATDGVPLTAAQVNAGLNTLEQIWDKYIDENGFQRPYETDAVKYKVTINVSNRGWASGAGTGDHDPAMWLHYNAFQDGGALAHEFAHSLQFASRGLRNSPYTGWAWESQAEWMRHQFYRDQVNCAEALVNAPHLYYGSTRNRYCNWQFWEFIKDKYCHGAINDIWSKAMEPEEAGHQGESPFSVLARNMGWTTSQLNDEFGDWALHNATWDYPNGAVYRDRFGSYADRSGGRRGRVTTLTPLDLAQRRFVVPSFLAPQRWGYNIVRLRADRTGADSTVRVTFRGVVQSAPAATSFGAFANEPTTVPNPSSDFRWGIVAREGSGATRYSAMRRGVSGEITFPVKATDTELYMVVAGTPSTLQNVFWDQAYYTLYRYPWMVQFQGAMPDGYEAGRPAPSVPGARHPNGGGWVASTARVASTAYVGPNAQVLDSAVISGRARIEDWAIIGGSAQIRDNAVVKDFAQVYQGQVYENAQLSAMTLVDNGSARIHGSARVAAVMNGIGGYDISGTAQLIGDVELWTSVSRGVFYGFIAPETISDARFGANRTAPSPEVTQAGPYTWRP